MPEITTRILNEAGLHARPATRLVELANRYESDIEIRFESRIVDAKKVIEVLTLAATQGTDLRVVAVGADADEALAAIEKLVETRFGFEEI